MQKSIYPRRLVVVFLLFYCIILSNCSQKSSISSESNNSEGTFQYLQLTYQFDPKGDAASELLIYQIDLNKPILYAINGSNTPVPRYVLSDENVTKYGLLGDRDTTILLHSDYAMVLSRQDTIDERICDVYLLKDENGNVLQEASVFPYTEHRIILPPGIFLGVSIFEEENPKNKIPLFNPQITQKGIPTKLSIPISAPSITDAIAEELITELKNQGYDVPSGGGVTMKPMNINLHLVDIEFLKERTLPKI